ncbi:Ger(x)C family spore germination protein [Paenibacillus chartarius]|uniref:Ger(X)C family spore germination protein n=1 Tax=Paenibacillus chartarius TaxID=747481 RepID=A0ABV6DMY7_9BACL
MKRSICCIALFSVLLTGCGFKDIDRRFFVLAMGVDLTNNPSKPYRVTLKLGIPSPRIEPGTTNKFQLVSEEADSITQAIRLLKSKVDKEIDFGHAKVFVFGKSLAEQDMVRPFDWFMRRRDIQMIGYVAIGEPSAAEVLAAGPPSERLPANYLFLSFDQEGTESSYIVTESISDFYRRLMEKGKDPYMPIIHVEKDTFVIKQVAVLDKSKVRVILSPEETRVFNQLVRGFEKFDVHTDHGDTDFDMSIMSYKLSYHLSGGSSDIPVTIHVKSTMKGMAEESSKPVFYEDWRELQEAVEKQSVKRNLHLLTLLQSKGVDPVGFGLRYRAMHYEGEKEWERWKELYPKAKFDVQVDFTMLSSGVIK